MAVAAPKTSQTGLLQLPFELLYTTGVGTRADECAQLQPQQQIDRVGCEFVDHSARRQEHAVFRLM